MSVQVEIRASGDILDPRNRDPLEHAIAAFWRALLEKAPELAQEGSAPIAPEVSVTRREPLVLHGTRPWDGYVSNAQMLWIFSFHRDAP